jgi:broad specificity phosphatase PhoE
VTATPPTRLLLARHGQSTWNAVGRWQGRADPPLSELGQRQAEAVAANLLAGPASEPPVDRVWCSPLQRARETAEIIGRVLQLEVAIDERVQEIDAGEWTGMTRAEIDEAWPGYLDEHRRPPGFESHDHLLARALEGLHEIVGHRDGRAGETVLVVTHGGVIRVLERHLDAPEAPVPNLGGRELLHRGADFELGERLVLIDPDTVEATTPRQI